jgi:hypothetical protein
MGACHACLLASRSRPAVSRCLDFAGGFRIASDQRRECARHIPAAPAVRLRSENGNRDPSAESDGSAPATIAKRAAPGSGVPAATMEPLCPAGQVPALRQSPQLTAPADIGRGVLKGNPLLRPQSGQTQSQPQSPAAAGPVLRFGDVYGKRGKNARRQLNVSPPQPQCLGAFRNNACFYYGSAGLTRSADGGGMTFSVDRPVYVNTGGEGHTLNEISVQGGANNGNIVELGWTVSTDQNGDADPHIFVFHWLNWAPTCYNGCGWQQVSNTYYPGQNIAGLVGYEIYVGYVFYGGNWWAWFNGQWLGYFPGTLWQGAFSKAAVIQWFGEVATNNGVPPKTQMGDGVLPPPRTAAHMFTLCDVDAKKWACLIRDQQQLGLPAVARYYDIKRTGHGDTRYGGPGN